MLPLLSVAAALAYVALLAAFVVWYPALKLVWLFVLPLVLLVPGRSFSSYLIDFFPAALVAAVSVAGVPRSEVLDAGSGVRRWVARSAVAVPLVASAAVCAVAFTSAPLDLSVIAIHTSQATLRLDSVTVTVHNSTGQELTPHFLVDTGNQHPMGFWSQVTPGGQLDARGGCNGHRSPPPRRIHLVAAARLALAGRGLHDLAERAQHLAVASLVARASGVRRTSPEGPDRSPIWHPPAPAPGVGNLRILPANGGKLSASRR